MNEELYESTKKTAYFLWEYTCHENALSLWHCAEDLACFFETQGYDSVEVLEEILQLSVYDIRYIRFVRHIAYRIYVYTRNEDKLANWYAAEQLLRNSEWLIAVCGIARIYNENKGQFSQLSGVHSDQIRQYYSKN